MHKHTDMENSNVISLLVPDYLEVGHMMVDMAV